MPFADQPGGTPEKINNFHYAAQDLGRALSDTEKPPSGFTGGRLRPMSWRPTRWWGIRRERKRQTEGGNMRRKNAFLGYRRRFALALIPAASRRQGDWKGCCFGNASP
jgi:hypothetical protein